MVALQCPENETWIRKSWACVQASEHAAGEFLLFIDADVRLKSGCVEAAIAQAQQQQIDLLSIAPAIVRQHWLEWLVQPIVISLLGVGFDFGAVNDSESATAFAAGPFMLFRRTTYEQIGGHRAVRNYVIALFPPETIPFLNVLSQIGLIFFMFLIGLELDPKYLKNDLNVAVLVSHVSIIAPFSFGTLAALLLYPLVSYDGVSFTAFALFLGAAMSITAFPVLARIITENNLQSTRLRALALTCAAVDDVTAWCLLAITIAVTRYNSMIHAVPTILEAILYITLMLTGGRLLLRQLATYYDRRQKLGQTVLAIIYMSVVVLRQVRDEG